MAYLVEIPVEVTGGVRENVQIEVRQGAGGLVGVTGPGHAVARAQRSPGGMPAGIRPVVESLVSSFHGMVHPPGKAGVEFGLLLRGEAGLLISRTHAEATFKAGPTWSRPAGGEGTGEDGPAAGLASSDVGEAAS